MALGQGTEIAGYRVNRVLGQGGMGVVYEATQLSLDRVVALKVLAPHLSDDVVFRERFRREGQIQAGIEHPHIVTVHEAGESEHGLFIVMRLVRGPNLKDMIVSRELDAGRSLRILGPIADALDAAHSAGLIHRDIKPGNILVGGRDHGFLADFGLTKGAGEKSLTRTGQFVGTLDYVSPEQIMGERATARSDIYSLAAVLYECLTGIVPYPKGSEAAVLYAHMANPAPSVTEQRPELPAALNRVIGQAMSKDPGDRHASASELLRDTTEAFSRRERAVLTPPRPIEVPEETGIRRSETSVPTQEAEQRGMSTAARAVPAPPTPDEDTGTTLRPVTTPGEADPSRVRSRGETPATAIGQTRTAATAAVPEGAAGAAPVALRRGASPGILIGTGGLLLILLLAGFLVGRSGESEPSSPAGGGNSAAVGALELSYPSSFARVDRPAAIPGLKLDDPIALGQRGRPAGDRMTAGMTDAAGPALLPDAFLRRLDGAPKRDDAVKLGNMDAYRYRDLEPTGFPGRLTLYVAPTTEGVATAACSSQATDAAAFLAPCEDVVRSLTLRDGSAFGLGPDKDYLDKLSNVMDRLNAGRKAGVEALRKAKTPRAQARAADDVADDYRSAARALRRVTHSPAVSDANDAIVAALERTESAYRGLASSARSGNASEYRAARRAVSRREAELSRALQRAGAA